MQQIPVEFAHDRRIRTRNKTYYRVNHWPIWIFVFFIAPGPLTFDLFERGFDARMAVWLGVVLAVTGYFGVRGRLPGCEPAPYIIRFTEDRPNPIYRRVCYTVAWGEVVAFAVLNIVGLIVAIATGTWMLKEIYRYAYFPLAGSDLARRRAGQAAAGEAVDGRRGPRAALLLRLGVGGGGGAADPVVLLAAAAADAAVRRLQARALRRHPRGDGPAGLPRTPAADAADRARRVGVARLMPRDIDALTSFTLKHLRDRWWDASFTAFLQDALLPQAGERVLDVGCGAGTAELILSALQPGGVHFVGIDLLRARLRDARRAMREQGVAAELATADAARLPFAPASFDAAFAVAVLQHVPQPRAVIDGLRRVLRPGGRLVLAEPDNAARYWFSDPASGHEVFARATEFYSLVEEAAGEDADPSIGPRVPRLLRAAGVRDRRRPPRAGVADPRRRAGAARLGGAAGGDCRRRRGRHGARRPRSPAGRWPGPSSATPRRRTTPARRSWRSRTRCWS